MMSLTKGRLKAGRHSKIMFWEKASKMFASVLKMMKSRDLLDVALKGCAFKPYNK